MANKMKIIPGALLANSRRIRLVVITGLLAYIFSLVGYPVIEKAYSYLIWLASLISLQLTLSVLIPITLLLYFLFAPGIIKYFKRHKNNISNKPPVFTFFDYTLVLIITITMFDLLNVAPHPVIMANLRSGDNWALNYIILTEVLTIALLLVANFKGDKPASSTEYTDGFSDEPISNSSQDVLGRNQFIEDFYAQITSLGATKGAFIFGLSGSWGDGKTSVLNLLRNRLSKNNDYLVINYQPWSFKDSDAITKSFYETIESSISEHYVASNLRVLLRRYSWIIENGLRYFGFSSPYRKEDAISEVRKGIESILSTLNKRIIIVIDDIDRLSSEEMLYVFKLVKANTDLDNIIFVLSFDRNYVVEALNEPLGGKGCDYIEKIVQRPIELPRIDRSVLDKFFDAGLGNVFDKVQLSTDQRKKFQEDAGLVYQQTLKNFFRNLRHCKTFFNGLFSSLSAVKDEVNILDFVILEIIRVSYHEVYLDIYNNPWYYIPTEWDTEGFVGSPFRWSSDNNEKYRATKEHIDSIFNGLSPDKFGPESKSLLLKLMEEIFFEVKNAYSSGGAFHQSASTYRKDQRISHPDCFRKYFTLVVRPSEMSDNYIKEIIKDLNKSPKIVLPLLKKLIAEMKQRNLLQDFFVKLMIFRKKIDEVIVLDVIRTIYELAGQYSEESSFGLWDSELDQADKLIIFLINDKLQGEKVEEAVMDIVANCPDFKFVNKIVLLVSRKRGETYNIFDNVDMDKLRQAFADRLSEHFVKKNNNIFELPPRDFSFVLYQWGTNWEVKDGKYTEEVNKYALNMMANNPTLLTKFLDAEFVPNFGTFDDKKMFSLKSMEDVYSLDGLKDIAMTHLKAGALSVDGKVLAEDYIKQLSEYRASQKALVVENTSKNVGA